MSDKPSAEMELSEKIDLYLSLWGKTLPQTAAAHLNRQKPEDNKTVADNYYLPIVHDDSISDGDL